MSAHRPKKTDRIPFENEGAAGGTRLNSNQRRIAKLLGELQLGGKRGELRKIYIAAIGALENKANPDRDAHCATSLRRIVEALFDTNYGTIYGRLSSVIHYRKESELNEYEILEQFESFIKGIVFKDISRVKEAVKNGDNVSDKDQNFVIDLVKSGRDYGYFFAHVESPVWLKPLKRERKVRFLKVRIERIEGRIFLSWPAQRYLLKLAEQGRKEAARLIVRELKNLKKYYKASPSGLFVIFYLLTDLVSRTSEATNCDAELKEIAKEIFKFSLTLKDENDSYSYDTLGMNSYLETYPGDAIYILVDFVKEHCETKNFTRGLEKEVQRFLLKACQSLYKENLDNREARMELNKLLLRPIPGYEREGHPFDNVRYALYGHYPEQTKEWIKEAILVHKDYAKKEYPYHFHKMIRESFKHFGKDWLTKKELEPIFKAIFSGPDRASREQTGKNWDKRRTYFRKVQLGPFETALFGEFKEFWESIPEEKRKNIENEHYTSGNFEVDPELLPVDPQSPITIEELGQMNDESLVDYLENWNDPGERWGKDSVGSIDFRGLSNVFRELILQDPERFLAWKEKEWVKIKRPVYFLAFVEAAKQRLEDGHDGELDRWLNVMEWILSRRDHEEGERELQAHDGSEFTWNSIQVECSYFLSKCIGRLPLDRRERILKILKNMIKSRDLRLEQFEDGKSSRDALDEAANTARCMALEVLVKDYPQWVQRHEGEGSQVPEVFKILGKRLSGGPAMTPPEHALLGQNFVRLIHLNRAWFMKNKRKIFPLKNFPCWRAAFGCVLFSHGPCRELFTIFEEDYCHALEKVEGLDDYEIDRLGSHAFDYWRWNEMRSKDMIKGFFEKAKSTHRGNLLHEVGRFFMGDPEGNEEEDLQATAKRAKKFFEQRLKKGDRNELVAFQSWINSECFEISWRLDILEKLMKKGVRIPWYIFSEMLSASRKKYPKQVMACFLEMTKYKLEVMSEKDKRYAKEIVRFASNHSNKEVSGMAGEIGRQLLEYDQHWALD